MDNFDDIEAYLDLFELKIVAIKSDYVFSLLVSEDSQSETAVDLRASEPSESPVLSVKTEHPEVDIPETNGRNF